MESLGDIGGCWCLNERSQGLRSKRYVRAASPPQKECVRVESVGLCVADPSICQQEGWKCSQPDWKKSSGKFLLGMVDGVLKLGKRSTLWLNIKRVLALIAC